MTGPNSKQPTAVLKLKGDFNWLEASTTNGGLEISGVRGKINLRTTNGSIKAELDELSADFSARTTNGSIRLALGQEANARFIARTTNGSIKVEYPVTVGRHGVEEKTGGQPGQGRRDQSFLRDHQWLDQPGEIITDQNQATRQLPNGQLSMS